MAAESVPPPSFRSVRWGRLAQKELREILRDRRTVITLVLMPILVYPLIGITFQKFLAGQLTNRPRIEYHLGFRTENEARRMASLLLEARDFLHAEPRADETPPEEPAGTEDDPLWQFQVLPGPADDEAFQALVQDRQVDVAIQIHQDRDDSISLELLTDEKSRVSQEARRFLENQLIRLNDAWLRRELRRFEPRADAGFHWHVRSLSTGTGASFSLSTLVPLILILMTVTGAVYPAIDLTAGERERGTMEALICAPVSARQVLIAKYLAVLTVALLTAVVNLLAMTMTAYITGLESLLFGRDGLSAGLVVKVFGVLVVFAGFFSAVLLTVTSFARSFKEAQAYLIPVMLISLAPGVLALMPGLEMTVGMALVPLANIVLLTRDLFEIRVVPGLAILALVSTFVYAVAALTLAAKVFGTDAVLYGSTGSWSDLWHRPDRAGSQPTPGQAWGCLVVVLPVFLLLGSWIKGWVETSITAWLIAQIVVTFFVFVAIPAISAQWQRIPLASAFLCRSAPALSFFAAAVAGLSLWPFAYEALISALPQERIQQLMRQFAEVQTRIAAIPYPVTLIVFAVAPALTEELFFRGYFLQGLYRGLGRWPAILVSAGVFGLFHVFVQGLSFERFIPSTILGICLGWVCVRTGSVWPGILLHVLHNGFLLTLSQFEDRLQQLGIGTERQTHLPAWLLVLAAVSALAAWGLMIFATSARFQRQDPRIRVESGAG
ncbi:MAG: ABC transporter permease subunit/CPBP intramembrane protease [Planctomycetaceae bacterium]